MTMIRVDFSKVAEAVLTAMPHRSDVARAMQGLGAAGMQYWKKLAQSELTSTSRDYTAGLQFMYENGKAYIELVGQMPNMIENGWPGGDMREWMLKSAKVKQGKNGPYLVIPFRHGTPGTGGRNVGTAMPKAIHDVAKTLAPTLSRANGGTQWGGRLGLHSLQHNGQQKARELLTTKSKPWHASSIFTGMIRKEKTYEKATQSSYQTFRTISRTIRGEKDAQGKATQHWSHPGIKARRFAPRVQKHLETIAMQLVAAAMK